MFCIGLVLFSRVVALVGGNYANSVKAGLWYWNLNEASSNSWTNIGARLIILVFDVYLSYMMRYLSAVVIIRREL